MAKRQWGKMFLGRWRRKNGGEREEGRFCRKTMGKKFMGRWERKKRDGDGWKTGASSSERRF